MIIALIKHARPAVDPAKPPEQWPLSDEGRSAALKLAESLRPLELTRLFHSDEVKAIETAKVVGQTLGIPFEFHADLREHDRSNVPHMKSGEFISHMELFFRKPGELVLGKETANECAARFQAAVAGAIEVAGADARIGIVTHGTVISLYLGALGAGKAFEIWRKMQLPSYSVVDASKQSVQRMVERIL